MTLQLTIDGVDFTAKWRLYESSWAMRAWQGEGAQSSFVIDDIDGGIDHANLAAKKIVEVWEDASGSNKCMYRGRVANKTLGMAPQQAPGVAMRWTVLTEDYNVDLKGIEVQGWERTEETDDERVEALRLDFLNGGASVSPRARTTTNLDGTYIGSDPADAAPLFDETYTDTDPLTVLTRIVEMTGRVFFVYLDDEGDGELVYFNRASDADDLLSDIIVVDDGEVEGVDDVTTFAAYRGPQAGDHGGQNILTGGSVRYMGGGYYRDSDIDGKESVYDKWEGSIRNDNIRREEAAQDFLEANVDASEETFTYLATIDMRAEYAHLIRAGMRLRIKRKRANLTTSQRLLVVSSEHRPIKPDADAEAIYQVSLEIGRPLNPHFTRSRFNIPLPPAQPNEAACQRLYFSLGAPGISPSYSAVWNTASPTGDYNNESMTTTPDGTYGSGGGSGSTSSVGGSSNDILLGQHIFTVTSGLADILTTGGTVRMQARARSRFGVGISESAQDNISQIVVRVFTSGGSLRGTAYAGHSLTTSTGSSKWAAQATHVNRSFPPAAASNAFSAVSGTVAGDKLVVETGYRSFTVGATGAALQYQNGSTIDLPEDELETDANNAWIAFCTSGGSGGDVPGPGTLPGEGQVGDSGIWADADHQHEHGFLADDGVHMHDADQIDGLDPDITGFVTTTDGGLEVVNIIPSSSSSVTLDLADGNVQDLTLDDDCTIAFTGATTGLGVTFILILRQDGTGGRVPTFPAEVIWPDDTEPTWSTDPDEVDVIEFLSTDGGTNWYGDAGGGSGTGGGSLDDLTDVTITAPAEKDTLRYNGAGQWINDDTRWEPVTFNFGSGPELVWDGDDLVMEWKAY